MPAWKKKTPAALARYNRASAGVINWSGKLAAEKKSPAMSVSVLRSLTEKAFYEAIRAEPSSAGRNRTATRKRNAFMRLPRMFLLIRGRRVSVNRASFTAILDRLKVPYLKGEAMRQAALVRSVGVSRREKRASLASLSVARTADAAAKARALQAAKTARDRALMRARSQRLSKRIKTNTVASSTNSKRVTNLNTLMSANRERTFSNARTRMGRPPVRPLGLVMSDAEKAAVQVEMRLALKSRTITAKSAALALNDAQKTAEAAAIRENIFGDTTVKTKKSGAVQALAGAALGFKMGGFQGAAIGAVAGFAMGKNKGGA